MKVYKNIPEKDLKEKLTQLYYEQQLTIPEVGKIIGLGKNKVAELIKKFKIKKPKRGKTANISFKQLKELYITRNLSVREVSEILYLHETTVQQLITKYQLKKDKTKVEEAKQRYCMEKYGTPFVSQVEFVKESIKKSNLEKYGVDCLFKDKAFHENAIKKAHEAVRDKYDVDNISQLQETKDKVKKTCQKRYGVDFSLQNETVKEKSRETCMKRYGTYNPSMNTEIIEKIHNTFIMKYGAYPSQLPEFMDKIIETNMNKYGVPYFCLTGIGKNLISKTNLSFNARLGNLGIETKLEFQLKNRSFDILILKSKILIELNPTYTHSTTGNYNGMQIIKPKDYHYKKSKLASDNGYHCIHVWDWDDKNKILNLFKSKEKLFARKCDIREVSSKEADEFNNLYHLQNTCRGQQVCLGLYFGDTLVSMMSFGKPRYNKNYQWELLRYTTHSDYMVLGGAEKLFKHFINDYNPESIISYCDYSKFSGQVYEKLGFKKIRHTSPTAHWVKGKTRITQAQLSRHGFDRLLGKIYGEHGKGSNNQELMLRYGFNTIYDCGQLVFDWKSNSDNQN